jgi:hypothetical protein
MARGHIDLVVDERFSPSARGGTVYIVLVYVAMPPMQTGIGIEDWDSVGPPESRGD